MYLYTFCATNLHTEKHGEHKHVLKTQIMINCDYISDLIDEIPLIFRYILLRRIPSTFSSKVKHYLSMTVGKQLDTTCP